MYFIIRLTAVERSAYLAALLGDESGPESSTSDSEDEEWFPSAREQSQRQTEFSDSEEIPGDRDSEVEHEEDDDEPTEVDTSHESEPDFLVAKDGTRWNKTPTSIQRQTAARNIIRQRCGPHRSTETLSILDTFKLIITNEMVDIIIRHTNRKANMEYQKYNEANPEKTQYLMSGANNSNVDHTTDMWKVSAYPLYRATMGINRFWNILRFVRFDDANTREARISHDKVAPIRDIWTMLNSNLSQLYRPSDCLTIDEQLYPYRGRTRFTQYLPSKPAKYGIKVWWICDSDTSYPLHGQIYTGKSAEGRETNQGERIVKDLAVAYKGSNRNITMDNFFMTLPVAKHLLSWNLTSVGTLKANKKYIPEEMRVDRHREQYSSLFGFQDQVTICSYVPKKNKSVVLLSTMHSDMTISTDRRKKPEIISYYNKTKVGVDKMDQMLRKYTTQRRTSILPLAFFYNILDIAALAAYIIYYENNKMAPKNKTNQRRLFLRQLSEELCRPIIED